MSLDLLIITVFYFEKLKKMILQVALATSTPKELTSDNDSENQRIQELKAKRYIIARMHF